MKKKYQYSYLIIALVAMVTLLNSCSKDQPLSSKITDGTNQSSVDSKIRPLKGGSLMLSVIPREAQPVVSVVNENFFSKDFYTMKDGYLRIDNVPEGIYKVVIHPQNPSIFYGDWPVTPDDPGYPDMVISDVKIANGVITNLGTIKLN